jgi:hypothetical protein
MKYFTAILFTALMMVFINGITFAQTVPSPQELKQLAESLPPYSEQRDCGFEALNVFEKFGGNIVVAQNPIPDGIYSVKKVVVPKDLAEATGPNWYGFCIWNNVLYLYYTGFGCYEINLVKRTDITHHRGIIMEQNGPHVWNIINGIVIDISWARQNIETFLDTVIVKSDSY